MDAQGLGAGPIGEATPLTGGTQNLLLRFVRSGRTYVLRRPPLNPHGDGNNTMRREARVLGALANSDAPHPRLIAACPDEAVLGAAFYLMEPIDGFNAPAGMAPLHAGDPRMRHAMGLSLIDALAALRRVDYLAAGLGDLGKPEGFLERQVPRWMKQLDSYNAYPNWKGRQELPGVERIAAWLEEKRPRTFAPGILHGDFHLGNVMFSNTGPEVAAIVDWELATIGDPMLDLGCLLATWTDPDGDHSGCIEVKPWAGFPTEEELVARYSAKTGCDPALANWYAVLAAFKLSLIQEGTYARASEGKADPVFGAWLHATSIKLLERALKRLR